LDKNTGKLELHDGDYFDALKNIQAKIATQNQQNARKQKVDPPPPPPPSPFSLSPSLLSFLVPRVSCSTFPLVSPSLPISLVFPVQAADAKKAQAAVFAQKGGGMRLVAKKMRDVRSFLMLCFDLVPTILFKNDGEITDNIE
jgi:hypothetical protein